MVSIIKGRKALEKEATAFSPRLLHCTIEDVLQVTSHGISELTKAGEKWKNNNKRNRKQQLRNSPKQTLLPGSWGAPAWSALRWWPRAQQLGDRRGTEDKQDQYPRPEVRWAGRQLATGQSGALGRSPNGSTHFCSILCYQRCLFSRSCFRPDLLGFYSSLLWTISIICYRIHFLKNILCGNIFKWTYIHLLLILVFKLNRPLILTIYIPISS